MRKCNLSTDYLRFVCGLCIILKQAKYKIEGKAKFSNQDCQLNSLQKNLQV